MRRKVYFSSRSRWRYFGAVAAVFVVIVVCCNASRMRFSCSFCCCCCCFVLMLSITIYNDVDDDGGVGSEGDCLIHQATRRSRTRRSIEANAKCKNDDDDDDDEWKIYDWTNELSWADWLNEKMNEFDGRFNADAHLRIWNWNERH